MFRRKTVLAGLFVIAFAAIALFPTIALADNAQCLLCHQSQMNTRPAQNFVVAPVNYATACSKCHLDFAGSHPYHNTDSYCGALCHDGWGAALSANVPNYSANLGGGVMGGFASANSTSTDPALLHIIHSKPRWMEDKSFASSSCKSCHAMVACDACHEGAPDPATHASHAATLSPSSTNNVSRGVLFGNQADPNGYTPLETSTCGATICHDTSGVAAGSPGFKDDSVHIADPATGYLANPTVVKTGAWVVMKASAYTLGKTSNSNATGATLSVPFNGSQIALVADKDPYRGIAEILIDNVSTGTVDLYNDTTINQVEVWRSAKLASGDHTITVRVTGTKRLAPVAARGAYIRVDQFKIYTNAPGSVAPRCTSVGCHAGYDPPNHGISSGGQSCYKCHTVYKDSMNTTGTTAGTTIHHVMGNATTSGDQAPNAGTYPNSKTDVFCVSCHTDHNYFNGAASKAGNLRTTAVTASGATTSATDFIAGGTGVCVSCHDVALAKELGGKQLASGAATTPIILGTDFNASAHNYSVPSTFGASATFNANCSKCHSDEQTKQYSTGKYKFGTHYSATAGILGALGAFTGNPPQEEACYKCHITAAGSGTDLKTVALKDAYGNQSMSTTAEATFGDFAKLSKHDLTKVTCANCHNVHAATSAVPAADPDNTYNVASVATTASANTFCLKCHDGTAPVQVVDGVTLVPYTVSVGTTVNVAANYSTNGHGAPSVGIDCRDCHDQHGSSLVHLLGATVGGSAVATYTDTNDEGYCLACHKAGGFAGASDIARYYPTTASGTADATMLRSGHRTKTVGTLAIGSAVPCRTCHDPHGGAGSGYMLEVRTQVTPGVDVKIGVTAGQLDMSDASQTPTNSVNTREFCFTCHTSSDLTQGWNGTAMAAVTAGSKVLGIDRTTSLYLHLPTLANNIKGHKSGDTYSCYLCHGDDFSGAGSVNVHNPAAGESRGGIPCYICHTVYRDKMEDGLGAALGLSNGTGYHHVLGNGTTRQGDSTVTPTLGTDGNTTVYCLSCHVDHDKFSPLVNAGNTRSKNLRSAYDNAAVTSASADWNVTSGGVCLGCHTSALTRDNTYQKAETSASVTASFTSAVYDASAHQYSVTSTFTDGSIFNAECVKCHDSEIDGGGMERGSGVAGFQTSTYKFSSHYSSARRLLGAMGVTITDPPKEENTCYACHSTSTDGFKTFAGKDWYNLASMDTTSQSIYDLIQLAEPSATFTSDTLNFWASADGSVTGNTPAVGADQSGDTYAGGTWQPRVMDPRNPTAVYESYDTANTAVSATTQTWRRVRFVSPPVASTVTVAASAWTVSMYDREGSTNANARLRPFVYVWRADNATKVNVVTAANFGTEMPTTAAPGGLQAMTTAAGASVTLQPGDKIVVDVAIQTVTVGTAGNYALTYAWGSNAAGFLKAPTAITWGVPNPGSGSAHSVGDYAGLHRTSPTDETRAYLSANKHVECTDCHGVHEATTGQHTQGMTTLSGALEGASGASATFAGTNWTAPTAYTQNLAPTKEYQICFKCHSGYNTNVTTWGGTGSNSWTDQGLEFSTTNQSYHPVVAALPATDPGVNGSSQLQAGDMRAAAVVNGQSVGGWGNGKVMYCSDCHAQSSAGSLGPHGSAVKWMLKGPNQAWPYTKAADNGKSTGTYRLGSDATSRDLGLDTADGLFCRNCHELATGDEHNRSGDHTIACVNCHIRVPHGGKVSRLLRAGPNANIPARYTANGQGGFATGGQLSGFNKQTSGTYTGPDCAQVGCSSHAASLGESW